LKVSEVGIIARSRFETEHAKKADQVELKNNAYCL